jgi:outer membrane protein assembly factor BamB
VLVPGVLFTILAAWPVLDLDPAPLMPMFMAFQFTTMIAMAVIVLWFLALAGLSWRTRLIGVVLAVVGVGGLIASIRKIEFSGTMQPLAVAWRWQIEPRETHQLWKVTEPTAGSVADLQIGPDDFPRYRGSALDGVAHGPRLDTDWSSHPPRELWRHPCGGGYAGFAVAGNSLVTIEQWGADEAIVCYDRATGRQRWAHLYPAAFVQSEPMGGDGPRATPTISDGDVFSVGAQGDLMRIDGSTGKPRWAVNILADSKAKNISWGMTGSPLIVGKLVIVNPGVDPAKNASQALAAYDKETGKRVWATGKYPAGYSSPQLVKLCGVEQVVLFDAGGLGGFDLADGHELWRFRWITGFDMNIVQPLVLPGDRLYISSEATVGGAMVQVKHAEEWSAVEVWQNRKLCAKFSNPVLHNEQIYGLSTGYLVCLDGTTGERRWKGGRFGSGQLLVDGDLLIVQGEQGHVALFATDAVQERELGRFRAFDGKTWNTPALAGKHLYLRTHTEMVCYELPVATP